MGEPHAQQGQQAWTRSLRIANVRQKETREIETMLMRGEDDPIVIVVVDIAARQQRF